MNQWKLIDNWRPGAVQVCVGEKILARAIDTPSFKCAAVTGPDMQWAVLQECVNPGMIVGHLDKDGNIVTDTVEAAKWHDVPVSDSKGESNVSI